MVEDYLKAMKAGKKAAAEKKGAELPVLDEILADVNIAGEVPLGLVDIPTERIVGTKTRGRTTAFAPNFMPMLDEGSEFAYKWMHLHDAHLDEGIRDPIICYEYMNKYYVMEGNKRVSVLKYFDAVTIPGYVTRVLPCKDGSLENRIYYEFVDFYQATNINFIDFSRTGGYAKLVRLTGHRKNQRWSYDDLVDFRSCYNTFEAVYKEMNGDKMAATSGDAFLIYLDVIGYDVAKREYPADMKEHLKALWPEVKAFSIGEDSTIKMDPSPDPEKKTVKKILKDPISTILSPGSDKKAIEKVAFIHMKDSTSSGWTYSHELGRIHVQEVFADTMQTSVYDNVQLENADQVIDQAIADGNKMIFTTTPQLYDATLKAALENPDIKFLNCSLHKPHRFIRTYYGRLFEATLLAGVIAGVLSDSDKIGYVANYPIQGITATINAFALGLKSVRPNAQVYLEWSTVKENQGVDFVQKFRDMGIHYAAFSETVLPQTGDRCYGLVRLEEDGSITNIAFPLWNWGTYYERIIRNVQLGTWTLEEKEISAKTQAYWWGMSSGVIDLVWSDHVPNETKILIDALMNSIRRYEMFIFGNKIYDQNGAERGGEGRALTYGEIINMDWLVDNVIGYIPAAGQMREESKQIVEVVGVVQEEE